MTTPRRPLAVLALAALLAGGPSEARAQDPNQPVENSLFVLRTMAPEPRLGGCEVTFFLLNGYEHQLDTLWLTATLHAPKGMQVDVVKPLFQYLDGRTAGTHGTFVNLPCRQIAYAKLREVRICKLGGTLYGDCLELLPERLDFTPPN